jgi:hypothetical protein
VCNARTGAEAAQWVRSRGRRTDAAVAATNLRAARESMLCVRCALCNVYAIRCMRDADEADGTAQQQQHAGEKKGSRQKPRRGY